MYRRLTDPELLRRLPHRSFCFYDIARNFYCTLLNIILHNKILCVHYFYNVCGGLGWYVCGTPRYNRYNTVAAFSFLNFLCQNIVLPIYLLLVHRFRNNCIIHLSTNPIAQFKKPQRSPLRLRFLTAHSNPYPARMIQLFTKRCTSINLLTPTSYQRRKL